MLFAIDNKHVIKLSVFHAKKNWDFVCCTVSCRWRSNIENESGLLFPGTQCTNMLVSS